MIKSTDFIVVDIEEIKTYDICEDGIQELIRKKLEHLQDGVWDIKQIINIETHENIIPVNGVETYFYAIRLYLLMELKHE